ncbi:hypothetical protein [Robbsia sp. KACC 23696]|uniref:hypothetical protein n=1 Tax=Robbsia sp. KACC 23696 TaxID=3149231 RepID=UPI00325C0FDF
MIDLERLAAHPEEATPDDVRELIRLLSLARAELPNYGVKEGAGTPATPDGEIGDIKSVARQ